MQDYSLYPDSLRDFLFYMGTIKGRSQKTVDEYGLDLRLFLKFIKLIRSGSKDFTVINKITIAEIDTAFLQKTTLSEVYEFLNYTLQIRENKPSARARKGSAIRSYFKYLTGHAGILKENPVKELDSPKLKQTLPKYLSLDDSKMLLNSVSGKTPIRDYAILTLFLNCGIRLSELVGININSIENEYIKILGKGNKERSVFINDACKAAIKSYLDVRNNIEVKDHKALFLSSRGVRISPKTVQWLVKKALNSAGLNDKGYSTHKLRHTAATLMYRYGKVDIRVLQEVLGHTSLGTTQIYTHVESDQVRDAIEKNPLASVIKQKNK